MMNKNNITQTVYNALFNRINRRLLIMLATIICLLSIVGTVYLMMQELPAVSVVVRRVDVNGKIQTSVRQMNAENVTINSNGAITGGLYIPGTPNVRLNGRPIFGGVVQGTGNPQPTNHQVTLNSNATLGKLFNRVDPVALPTVAEPPATSGTRDVSINNANDQIGDFATIRDLTINGNVPPVVVPTGTYRNFTANNGGFILGVSGATQPSVYNFNKLTLNGNAQLQVLGPVIVTLKETVTFNGSVGNSSNSNLLTLKVSNGSVTLNGNASLSATVIAPTGTVTVNGNCTLKGVVIADKLTVNGNGVVNAPTTAINAPSLSIQQPANNTITQNNTVTVTGTVASDFAPIVKINGAETALNGNSFSADVTLAEGSNTINVTATDFFSNQTTATVTVIKDTTPPVLTINQPNEGAFVNTQQVLVTGTVSDSTTTQVTVNDVIATISNGQYTATVPINNEGINTLTVKATDFVSNQTTLTRNVIRDTTPPLLTVTQPQEGDTFTIDEITVTGSFMDTNSVIVMVNGVAATISANDFTATVPLNNGVNTITIIATDIAGNQSQVIRNVVKNGGDTTPPNLEVFSPEDGSLLGSVTVSGKATDQSSVTLTVNGIEVFVDQDGNFLLEELFLPEGLQQVNIVVVDAAGNQSQVMRNVNVDTTPPVISNISPAKRTLIASQQVTIQGQVSDISSPVTVFINQTPVTPNQQGIFIATIPVIEGENPIIIFATDAVGNNNSEVLTLFGKDFTPPQPPMLFPVTSLTRLTYQTIEGRAEGGSQIRISGGSNLVITTAALENGLFVANVDLTAGTNNLSITSTDSTGNVSTASQISIVSNPNLTTSPSGQAYQINISTGDSQRGLTNMELPRPLIVNVTDKDGNFVPGASIKFSILQGGKFINDSDVFTTTTDASGHASASYICSSQPGVQLLQADFTGNTLSPVKFVAEALKPTPGEVTTFSGTVLDQNMRSLPNVLVRLNGQQTRTDSIGEFTLTNVNVGPHQVLELIGRDQITLPGRWPNISYDVDILPEINNTLRRPLFLPRVNEGVTLPLDASNMVTQDIVVEQAIVGNLPIKVKAHNGTRVIFPADVTDKRLSVTRIAVDRIPMELEEGRYTSLYISVQPSGAIFDPPLEITFPNLDQLPANSTVLLMSFDHDAGRYVQVGTGRVSADGKQISSDPGSGIRVGAWHGFPPSAPSPSTTLTGDSQGCMCMVWANGTQAIPIGSSTVTITSPRANSSKENINPLAESRIMTTKYRTTVPSAGRTGNLQAQCIDCPDINFVRQRGVLKTPAIGDEIIPMDGSDNSCLMVSKFQTNIDLPSEGDTTFAPQGSDPDTFRIQATSSGIDTSLRKFKVKIEVISGNKRTYNETFELKVNGTDDPNNPKRTLYKTKKYFRLVSNNIDDGERGDQTIKVKLLDTVTATLIEVVEGKDKIRDKMQTFTVGNATGIGINTVKTVECNFWLIGNNAQSKADIKSIVEQMDEYWAQAAIKFRPLNAEGDDKKKKFVINAIKIRGSLSGEGTFSIKVNGTKVNNFTIGTFGRQDPMKVAEDIAAGINASLNSNIAYAVNTYPSNDPDSTLPVAVPSTLVIVDKGKDTELKDLNVSTILSNNIKLVSKSRLPDGEIDLFERTSVLAANYSDSNRSTIDIFIVDSITNALNPNKTPAGAALYRNIVSTNSDIVNSCFVEVKTIDGAASRQNEFPNALSHEIGHLLLNAAHEQNKGNLMFEDSPQRDAVDVAKRLTSTQHARVRNISGSFLK